MVVKDTRMALEHLADTLLRTECSCVLPLMSPPPPVVVPLGDADEQSPTFRHLLRE